MDPAKRRRHFLLLLLYQRLRQRTCNVMHTWVREIFLEHEENHSLINNMRFVDHSRFYKYSHMSQERFNHLLSLVGPSISREVTKLRNPILAGKRLVIT